ncbi:MAG: membrane protein insertion efficiency factor YidD [Parachlamydiales bacterium]|jgi:putative component of membrane protein insertase Oxa1/YidC/SpoIIIJ protein YidD
MKNLFFFLLMIPIFIFAKNFYIEPWGKDCDLLQTSKKNNEEKKSSILSKAADKVIIFHQKVISPVDGPRSHFRPTSSRYMQLAIQRYGFFKGYIMGCDRLLRENNEPWVYKKITIDNIEFKYDPASDKKYITLK